MNDEIDRLKSQARNSMHAALAALHAQHVALVRDGRGEHAPADALRRQIRQQEELLRRMQA